MQIPLRQRDPALGRWLGRQAAEIVARQRAGSLPHADWKIVAENLGQQSVKSDEREQFRLLFQDVSQRHFEVLLFWSPDRFSCKRSPSVGNI